MSLANDSSDVLRNLLDAGPANLVALATDLDWSAARTKAVLDGLIAAGRVRREDARVSGVRLTLYHVACD